MYRSKEDGVATGVFEPRCTSRPWALKVENDMRCGHGGREFVVATNLRRPQTGEVWGIEALVRWVHPSGAC